MYMKAMFPAGMADTKKELMEKVGFSIEIDRDREKGPSYSSSALCL
jgi:hypothetical protein